MNKSCLKVKLKFDRLLSKSLWKQFLILGVVLLVALGISYLMLSLSGADWEKFCYEKDLNKWLLPIYLLIDSNALNNLYISDTGPEGAVHGWMLIVSSITFLIGAFVFNGLIISIITNSIEQRVSDHKQGHIHYLKSDHYVIMGYDDMVSSIIVNIFEKKNDAYILLLSATNSELIRERLLNVFTEKQLEHIIINHGHRISKDYYNDIHIESAEQVFIVGKRTLPAHDAINVECVDSICTYLEDPQIISRPKRITCVFEDLDTYAAFKTTEIFNRVRNLGIEFVPYNFYAGWAKQVFVKQYYKDADCPGNCKINYPAVYGAGITPNDKSALTQFDTRYVHLVFVGTTNFAVAFAMEAAQVLHFPNGDKVKTRITFIDKNADEEKSEFIIRNQHFFEIQSYYYRDLSQGDAESTQKNEFLYFTKERGYKETDANFLDIEFEFIKGDVFSKAVQDVICEWAEEHNQRQYLSVFLALANQRQNFLMGMNMPDKVYYSGVPIFIRQNHSDNFVSNLRKTDEMNKNSYFRMKDGKVEEEEQFGRYANIYPFGMNETSYTADEKSLKRAKLINYLYSTMQNNQFQSLLALNAMSEEQIWIDTDEFWRKLSVSNKWSNLYNAYTIRIKLSFLRSLRGLTQDDKSQDTWPLNDNEAEILARVEHNRWNVEKLLMGYRKPHQDEDKYGKDKNDQSKLKQNKKHFIHHDIRPFDGLDDVKKLDEEFARYIPWIIKMSEDK